MKKDLLLILVAICSLLSPLSAQQVQSSCEAADSLRELIRVDAEKLAFRHLIEEGLPDTAEVAIPIDLIDTISSALIAVYNAIELEARQDIVERYDIHVAGNPELTTIVLEIDATQDWLSNYLDGKITGIADLDLLTEQYDLRVLSATELDNDITRVLLRSERQINTRALARRFAEFPGVLSAEREMIIGGVQKDISYSQKTDHQELIYRYSWGDCISGCQYDHFWRFSIYAGCVVTFDESYGAPLAINSLERVVNINLSPNPTSDLVNISLLGPVARGLELFLYDARGQLLKSMLINSNSGVVDTELSLWGLPVGVYFIAFRSDGQVLTEKILKR